MSRRVGAGWVNRFYFALEYNDLHSVRHLITQGVNVNHIFKQVGHQRNGQTAIFIAASKNFRDLARELIHGGSNLEHTDMWGETPLFVAVRRGKLPMIKQLVAAGSNINHQNNRGENVLFLCIKWGRKDLVDYFLSIDVSVDAVNKDGSTPVILALELMSDNVCGTTRNTRRRAPSNMVDIIDKLIPSCSSLNHQHPIKGSALRLALNIETTRNPCTLRLSKLLLQHGAVPDRLFFLRFGGLNAATTQPGSEFFTQDFFNLALEAGAFLQREKTWLITVLQEMPQELEPFQYLFEDLLSKSMSPMSLQTLCHINIRQLLGGKLWKKIEELPLPNTLKDCLKLKIYSSS